MRPFCTATEPSHDAALRSRPRVSFTQWTFSGLAGGLLLSAVRTGRTMASACNSIVPTAAARMAGWLRRDGGGTETSPSAYETGARPVKQARMENAIVATDQYFVVTCEDFETT